MKKIGLIGEDPNDTTSLKNLLLQKHPSGLQFKQLIKNKKGYQLDNAKIPSALKIEYDEYKPQHVIFIRDADSLPTNIIKIQKIKDWFNKLNEVIDGKGILLINIYELEALILADIDTFNLHYNTTIRYAKNVMYQQKPKEFLIQKTWKTKKRYSESHCPDLFMHLKFDTIIKKAAFFNEFYSHFVSTLKIKK